MNRKLDRIILKHLLKIKVSDAEPLEQDEEVWRTVSEGNNKGKHFLIETETGEIKGGLGGKMNGVKAKPKNETQSNGSSAPSKPDNSAKKAEWSKKLHAEMDEVGNKPSRQAQFLFESEFMSYDDAVDAMHNKDTQKHIDNYLSIMEQNGDPTPTKKTEPQMRLTYKQVMSQYGDYNKMRKSVIADNTGWDEAKVEKCHAEMTTWFGGSWYKADTAVLDEYVDKAPAYDGEIYRGLHFTEDEYQAFMQSAQQGATIGMRGKNSSWTSDKETADMWTQGAERRVVLVCTKNRTSTPVNVLSDKGEDEVLAHSKAGWTVLRAEEGADKTYIYVVEKGEYNE